MILGHNPWKRESGGLRLLWFFSSNYFGSQPLRKGMVRFEIAVCFFSSNSFGTKPLRKGIWRFEIAVGAFFFHFFWVTTLEKGNGEV